MKIQLTNENGKYQIYKVGNYGNRSLVKEFKQEKAARRFFEKYQPQRYVMTLAEGLMLEGKI